jgi:hypothetical protein
MISIELNFRKTEVIDLGSDHPADRMYRIRLWDTHGPAVSIELYEEELLDFALALEPVVERIEARQRRAADRAQSVLEFAGSDEIEKVF